MNVKKVVLPLSLVLIFALGISYIQSHPATANKGSKTKASALSVKTQTIQPRNYQITLSSYGRIQASTQSRLVSEVSGKITSVSEQFKEGGFFNKGDVLLNIDARDYDVQVKISSADLAAAKVALEEENNRALQAKKEWASTQSRSHSNAQISAFALRKPQVAAAQAAVKSAQARYEQALVNRNRTQIRAPFDGRLLNQLVDLGDVVNVYTPLANIYASDKVEVRMPLNYKSLGFIELPNATQTNNDLHNITVINPLTENSINDADHWQGSLIRTAATIDEQSQQLHVIAKIQSPFTHKKNQPLKIGQYVDVLLQGKMINDAIVIPNKALYQNSHVFIVEGGVLQKRHIELIWQNENDSIIKSGLVEGDNLVTTPLGQISSGTKVTLHANKIADMTTQAEAHLEGQQP